MWSKKVSVMLVAMLLFFLVLSVSPQNGLVAQAQDPSLLGYWKFDEGSGTTASDSSGNNKHGTVYGALWTDGNAGNALQFDGADDHVDFPILYSSSPSALTVIAWIKFPMTGVDIYRDIVWHGDNGEFELQFRYDALGWGEAIFKVKLETGVWSSVGAGEIPEYEWHQIAGVWTRADKIKIYKDGTLTAEQPVGDYALLDPGPTFARGVIGAYHDSVYYTKHFIGAIDEVRIYNRALSVDEIIALRDNPQPIELTNPREEIDTYNLHRYEITYTDHVNGRPISYFEPETLIAQTSSNEMHVRKAVDSNGDAHMAWMSSCLGQWEIYYKEISSDGTVKVPVELISDTPHNSMFPSIALDSSNDAHIVWTDRRDDSGTTWEIYYSKIQDNTGTDLTLPDWRVSNADGKDSGRAVQPSNPIDDAATPLFIEHPDIDVDSQSNVHIVWSDYRDGNWDVYYQKQNNAATPTVSIDDQSISALDTYNSQNPAIAAGPDISGDGLPDIHIVWQDNRDGNWEIYYEKLSGTSTLVNDNRLTLDDNNHSATPDIDIDTSGCPHIVFMDQRSNDPGHAEDTHLYSAG